MAFMSMKLLMSIMSVPGALGASVKQRRGEVCQDRAAQYSAAQYSVKQTSSLPMLGLQLLPPMTSIHREVIYPPTTLPPRHSFFPQYFP